MRLSEYLCLSMLLAILLLPLPTPAAPAPLTPVVPQKSVVPQKPVPSAVIYSAVYENATLTEDTTLRGVVAVKGALVIAPQTTLRIEPGASIHFLPARNSRQLPRLVVMGRLQAVGSLDRPIILSGSPAGPARSGEWGGVLLLSSEKRNQIEYCRIEGAEIALEARFSTFSAKALTVSSASVGLLLNDSTANLTACIVSGCQTGIEAHDSEVELRESTAAQNRRGLALYRSSVVLASVTLSGNKALGLLAEECRLKMTSCEVSGSTVGARISGGEGQLFLSRFVRNLETALHLSTARLKVSRCQISDNLRDGARLEDGRATLWGNLFSGNGGYNMVIAGIESVTAVQNWWGAADETSILLKIYNAGRDGRFGEAHVFPWLTEKPALFP